MANALKIKTPHAAVIVFNYRDRIGSEKTSKNQVLRIDRKIISSVSIESIRTTKTKSEPAGTFEIALAPTRNWVSTLTAGSWLCILMGQQPIEKEDLDVANPKLLKMVGRIEAVRMSVVVDPATGARRTSYIVSGQDWGGIFQNILYVDPIIDGNDSTVGAATKMNLNELIYNRENALFKTSTELVQAIINFWGMPLKNFNSLTFKNNITISNEATFVIPNELAKFLSFNTNEKQSNKITDKISLIGGTLVGDNKYRRANDSVGLIDPRSLYGAHAVWQIMTENSNPTLNELYCDINWDLDKPRLALYHRIKPFIIRDVTQYIPKQERELIGKLLSPFKFVKKNTVPVEEVITIDAGTNWRDKYNFVEIRPDFSDIQFINVQIKNKAQVTDREAYAREGFRPMIAMPRQLAKQDIDNGNVMTTAAWKWLLREWYFDTHRLLNGNIVLVGQDTHIEIGTNLMIDASVFGNSFNMVKNMEAGKSFLLAHVENIAHSFSVLPDGSRSFTTTVQFVRGTITDEKGEAISDSGRLDGDVRDIDDKAEESKNSVVSPTTTNPSGGV